MSPYKPAGPVAVLVQGGTRTSANGLQRLVELLIFVVPGEGMVGSGRLIAWGSSMIPPEICVELPLSAVTFPAVHDPTPTRGVESDPYICTLFPLSDWLPFVPTFPAKFWKVGEPVAAPLAATAILPES